MRKASIARTGGSAASFRGVTVERLMRNPFTNLTAAHNIMAAFALHTRRIKSVKSKQAFRKEGRGVSAKADEQARCRWCDVLDK